MKLNERPFSKPISPLTQNVEETVYFPCDDEKNANGLVSLSWHGPYINDLKELIALDVLFNFLSDSSISLLHSHFIDKKSYCNKISYKIVEYRLGFINVSFLNAQLNVLDQIRQEFFELMNDLVNNRQTFDLTRLQNILKMKISELNDKLEDSPHETLCQICIGDFLYGSEDESNKHEFQLRFSQNLIYEDLCKENVTYWLDLLRKYVLDAFHVQVIGRPSEELMKSIADEDEKRVEERKKRLGKKGLKELQTRVDNAQAENDVIILVNGKNHKNLTRSSGKRSVN
jgi:Zn-dependent M16 (insulinase) family peptidase